jgi:SAM-dependent methyltransferase
MTTPPRYEEITETAGVPLSPEGADMMYTRYMLAQDLAAGRRVLELGCGAGVGFGLLRQRARVLVGGDYSAPLLREARSHYGSRVPVARLSAEDLPFQPAAFDLVVFFEASYYVADVDRALAELARVLAPDGIVFLANANPERPDFIRSPHSIHYHTADEFRMVLGRYGFQVAVSGAFPVVPRERGVLSRGIARPVSWLRKALEALGLIPKTLKGRALLKRLIYGRLIETPAEIPTGFATVAVPEPVSSGPARGYKVIYVRGEK